MYPFDFETRPWALATEQNPLLPNHSSIYTCIGGRIQLSQLFGK